MIRVAIMVSDKIPSPKRQAEILSGWKEIASYLGMGVRTIQRYEREAGLPVHRRAGEDRGSVVATKTELGSWVCGASLQMTIPNRRLQRQINRNRANFLLIDSQIALTFSGIALGSADGEKRRRTTVTARKAYDTITRLRKNVVLTDMQKAELNANLERLEGELQWLGESVA
jgi:hypothetical protein